MCGTTVRDKRTQQLQVIMWHEARKQEKKIRDVMINYQRRAERRKEHYEKLVGVL